MLPEFRKIKQIFLYGSGVTREKKLKNDLNGFLSSTTFPLPENVKCPASHTKLSLSFTDVTSNPIHLSHCGGRQGQPPPPRTPLIRARFHPRASVMLSRNGVTRSVTITHTQPSIL